MRIPHVPFTRHAGSTGAAIALVALAGACGSASPTPAQSAHAPPHTVTPVAISGYAYRPAAIIVARGTKITFTNHDQTAHTVTSTVTGFDSGTIDPGKSAAITMTKPGTYTYYCQFHAFMHGTITVR